jgi:DNA-binding CsgD family transcriptional regulator
MQSHRFEKQACMNKTMMHWGKYILLLIEFSYFNSTYSSAQLNSPTLGIPEIESYTRSDYRAGTQNWAISQTTNGLIYIANNDGILEFDGSFWNLIPRVTNNVVRAVLTHESRIYTGSHNEIGYYEKIGHSFTYTSINKEYNLRDIGEVWSILPFNDQIVFQTEKMLCIYKEGHKVEIIQAKSRFPSSFLVNGMLLVHDEQEGLMELRQNKLFMVPGGNKVTGDRIGAILPVSNREIIIGTMQHGLYRWQLSGIIEKWHVPADTYLTQMNIFSGAVNGQDLIFGTIQSGIVVVSFDGNIKLIVNKAKGLNNNTVLSTFIDNEKNIWAGLDNGIAKIAQNSSISFLHGYFDIGSGYCIERKNGMVYLGTNQGLHCIDEATFQSPMKNTQSFTRINGTDGQVWSLFDDGSENGLLCGHNSGAFAVEGNKARLLTPPNILVVWKFRAVPNRKDLLIAGISNGLILFQKDHNNQWQYKWKIEGFDESTMTFEWDIDGGLWITHGQQGIFKVFFDNNYHHVIKIETATHFKGISNDKDITLAVINGQLVFVSTNGLYKLNHTTHTFQKHEISNIFENDKSPLPHLMQQDRYKNIWFFSHQQAGVLRLQEDGTYKRITNPFFPLKDKLIYAFESIYVWDKNNTIFGIVDGFAHYTVNDQINFLNPFYVHIRTFKGSTDSTAYAHNQTEQNNTQTIIPQYSFADNAFEVAFAATWFGTGNIEYASYLEGFDKTWTHWSETQKRQFTRLKEGVYTLNVKARNIHGVETTPLSYSFIVQPPWYRTTYAKIVYIILLLISGWGMWHVTSRIVEKSRQREKIRQMEKFRLAEEQLRHEALINEKEMIKLRNEKLNFENQLKEKELANSTMNIIQKNEFLIKLKEDLSKAVQAHDSDGIIKKISQTIRRIDQDIDNDSQWQVFETHLEQVHQDFLERLQEKHNDLLPRELKLCAYLRMGMSSKEIASLMNISSRAVENNRYKLRKKMGMDQGDNLLEYIMKL